MTHQTVYYVAMFLIAAQFVLGFGLLFFVNKNKLMKENPKVWVDSRHPFGRVYWSKPE